MVRQLAPIVVGVDGSDASRGAVHWAADEAAHGGRPLRIVHALGTSRAFGWPENGAGIVDEAAELARAWAPTVDVQTAMLIGSAGPVLLQQASTAAMVVIASRGLGAIAGAVLGSVGSYLCTHAACPVLVVHHAERWAGPETPLPHAAPVVLGVDPSPAGQAAWEAAFTEAAARRTKLVAVRAVAHMTGDPTVERQTRAALSDLTLWRTKFPDVGAELSIRRGGPAAVLRDAARTASLIVLSGSPGRHGLTSVLQQVLRGAFCSVLVVRKEAGHAPG
jgi:nucleotide-binding universal stress UspA family protein